MTPAEAADYQRRYAQTPRGKEVASRAKRLYRERHRDQKQAWNAVQNALNAGRLAAEPCSQCGADPAQAHHHLGYDHEHWLDVVWLCDSHHKARHTRWSRKEEAAS